jgi:hypothetical protein
MFDMTDSRFRILLMLAMSSIYAGVSTAQGVISLPKTGQTTCYTDTGSLISCSGTGQDGDIRAGVDWPSPRFTFSSFCFTDQLTGLTWITNGISLPSSGWTGAVDYANTLSICGFSDWRLGNANEITSISNSDVVCTSTWLQTQGISYPSVNGYSSTTVAGATTFAWNTQLCEVPLTTYGKTQFPQLAALPVRGGQANAVDATYPANIPKTGQTASFATGDDGDVEWGVAWPSSRFTNNGDGTITDELTGLDWTQDANTPGPPACSPGTTKRWQAALDHAQCLNANNFLGHSGWRVPNKFEMRSLIDYGNSNPALPTGHPFTNVGSAVYWTSTTILSTTNRGAWTVNLFDGRQPFTGIAKDITNAWIWPVRDGGGGGGPMTLGPFFVADVLVTPPCWSGGGCTPGDFPFDWGIVRTFDYTIPVGQGVEDVLINGTWGGDVFNSSAPVQVYLEDILVTECLVTDPCWSEASKVDWNGGAGFLLSDLGVDFMDPAVQALFWDGSADLSLIQTDTISANISNLSLTLYVPEPGGLAGLLAGVGWLGALGMNRRRRGTPVE